MKTVSMTAWDRLLVRDVTGEGKRARWRALRDAEPLETIFDERSPTSTSTAPREAGEHVSSFYAWRIAEERSDPEKRSIKFRLLASDHQACESVVLFPRPRRATACVSTQIGCAVSCPFCATGSMGWRRNLTLPEILEQIYLARQRALATDRHLRNVVFMGMGEPLHNFETLLEAIDWITSDQGFGMSPRHVTVSTAGIPSRMIELATRFPRVRQALSLHSAIPETRRRLVPHATGSLETLQATIGRLNQLQPEDPVWLEYVLLDQVNDQPEAAERLLEFCRGLRVEINVIPFNPPPNNPPALPILVGEQPASPQQGIWRGSSREAEDRFLRICRQGGIFTTLRKSLGRSIGGACGQLVNDG